MDEAFEAVVGQVRERTTPDEAERALLERVAETVTERAEAAIDGLPIEADVMQVGSTVRNTWVSGDRDVDVFVRFPPDLDRPDLERYGLAVGSEVLPDGREEYAEHPYVAGEIEGVAVDLVPCYRVGSATEIRSAVDRTPFHTRYLDGRLDDRLAADVRVCKAFLVGIGAYGSDLRTRGFSGYLAELLVVEHGGFGTLVEAAADWSPPIRFDPEGHGTGAFDDPLVAIDPTDPERNVAAVLSATQLARFQHYTRELLDDPRESLFERRAPEPIPAAAVREAIAARGTTPIALRLSVPALVDDQLYPQLEKSSAGIERALDDRGFGVLRRDAFAADDTEDDEDDECVLLFELEVAERPRIERHEGPPINVREHARRFYETYAETDAYGPFIDGDRYVVERSRDFTSATEFVESDALFGAGLGAEIETALDDGYDLLVGEDVADLATRFDGDLARYFAPRP
jgi:tRNA nucleotidyltransferase (CCA-adding enzyme)